MHDKKMNIKVKIKTGTKIY